jgi:hypothetical protein
MDILLELERLAAAFPWDRVNVEIHREPNGETRFVVYVPSNEACGFYDSIYVGASSMQAAVDRAISEHAHTRDPKIMQERAIKAMEEKLAKLRAANFDFPPYVPNRAIAQHIKPTVDI